MLFDPEEPTNEDESLSQKDKLSEMETIITFNRFDKTISFYTADSIVNKKLLHEDDSIKPEYVNTDAKGKEIGWSYTFPKTKKGKKFIMAAVEFK